MTNISELELQNLRHLIGGFDTTHCKLQEYASEATDTKIKQFFEKSAQSAMDNKQQLLWIRFLIIVFVAISAIIALIQYKSNVTFIAQLMGISWGALAGAFLAPFLYSLYWKKTTKASCWVCFLFGSILMIANMVVRPAFPVLLQSPINCGAFAMLAGLVIVPVVSWLTRKPDEAYVEEIFDCYNKETTVPQKTALGK